MFIDTTPLKAIESRFPKIISPRIHGYIDYAHAGFFLTMALVCRKKNPSAALAALGTGTFVLVQSLMTDYALGAKRMLPFAVHGQMDAGFAALSPLVPKMLGFEGTAAARIFQANGFVEGTVVCLTDFSSARAHAEDAAS